MTLCLDCSVPVRATPWSRIAAKPSPYALQEAGPGDIVLIAGKGHEKTQIVRQTEIPFDDVAVARELLAQAGYEKPAQRVPSEAVG